MNIDAIERLASSIKVQVSTIKALEEERSKWVDPESHWIAIGENRYWVVRKDGTVTTGLEGLQREAIKAHDIALFSAKSVLEGLLWKLNEERKAA